ncbi:hypothetical protein BAE44_0020365 [Dichanthelium oligosanthes]|uniref:Uncharacterized protein n=1 Tax=Dichanthelium oligosanthes TaxID=888268 RepID=A0A1E5V0E5_9POAL|nr:hypothetical protein BAE44_0020365 [Dichanthelium oligosanthes]
MYELNVDHFDSDDSGSEDDLDSRARRLENCRLFVRLAGESGQRFLAVGTRIFDFYPCSSYGPSVVFNTRTQLATTTPSFQAPKECTAFWTAGRTVYALGCRPPECRRSRKGTP